MISRILGPLLENVGDGAGADGVAAFADGKPQPLLQRHGRDQLNLYRHVVSRHHHLHPRRQLHVSGHVRGAKVELRPVPGEERRVSPALFLGENVRLGLELGVRRDGPWLAHHLTPLHLFLFRSPEDRKSTRLNSSHGYISYAVFCLKKKKKYKTIEYYNSIN